MTTTAHKHLLEGTLADATKYEETGDGYLQRFSVPQEYLTPISRMYPRIPERGGYQQVDGFAGGDAVDSSLRRLLSFVSWSIAPGYFRYTGRLVAIEGPIAESDPFECQTGTHQPIASRALIAVTGEVRLTAGSERGELLVPGFGVLLGMPAAQTPSVLLSSSRSAICVAVGICRQAS